MAILNEYELHRLAVLSGIDSGATIQNKQSLLIALDVIEPQQQLSDEAYAKSISDALNKTLDEAYASPLSVATVLRQDREKEVEFVVPAGKESESLNWTVHQEKGGEKSGSIKMSDTTVKLDDEGKPMIREINGVKYEKRVFKMPEDFEIGYHSLDVEIPGQPKATTRMIYAPTKCFDPINIKDGGKAWGVPVQLYEQRSDENQGIGDFSDLAELADTLGKNGAGILGVNPLHAMFPEAAEEASPYAPASRTYFNHIYLDVTAVPEFEQSKEAVAIYDSEDYTKKRRKAQAANDVDYTAAIELKTPILNECFNEFVKSASPERKEAFETFKKDGGPRLNDFAVFQALSEHFAKEEPKLTDWRDWPPEFQDAKTPEVQAFAKENSDRVEFYSYLQFETLRQMENVQETCKESGMKVGLYTDIAVGSAKFGFEAWGCKDLYMKASAGAPADVLSPNGQDWDIMGFKPKALKESGYEPFVEMLRNNMKTAGCTRLDHVLQLARLYMIPEGKSAKEGAFVYYPVDELMAIAALESHRNECMLIGEDLGQLPPGFQDKLMDHGILSYRVMPFEREWGYQNGGDNNAFRHPEEYPQYSTAAPSTHDTPSLASQWRATDVHLKDYLGYYEAEAQRDLEFKQYESQRCALNHALQEKGCWEKVGGHAVADPAHDTRSCPEKYEEAVADYLGQSKSAMLLYPFSDMFRTNYMGNIPGTRQRSESQVGGKENKIFEPGGASLIPWKNWRPKMHIKVNEIKEMPVFKNVSGILNDYRQSGNENSKNKGVKVAEFKRPGRTETKSRDSMRVVELHEALEKSGYFKTHAYDIIAAKFSEKRRQRDLEATKEFKENYEARRRAIEEKKKAYQKKTEAPVVDKKPPSEKKTPEMNSLVAKALGGKGGR